MVWAIRLGSGLLLALWGEQCSALQRRALRRRRRALLHVEGRLGALDPGFLTLPPCLNLSFFAPIGQCRLRRQILQQASCRSPVQEERHQSCRRRSSRQPSVCRHILQKGLIEIFITMSL